MSLSLSTGSDAELVTLALGGRQDAYAELLGRHREAVFRLVRSTIGDASEALDITQEVFISSFAALSRFDRSRPFAIWLKRIALNKCRDWARRRKVRSFFTRALPLDDAWTVYDDAAPPDVSLSDREELRRVSSAIGKLPSKLKEVLVLRTVDGLSQSEAAEVLGVSEKAVETRLYRARAKLRDSLEE